MTDLAAETIPYPEGAERYRAFREAVLRPTTRVGEPGRTEASEIEIQAMWFGGEFGRIFTGTGGESIEIIQFGHWNRGAGPDFTEVAVEIDGTPHVGDLEIDLDASGWEEHGHGGNPNFDSVVLHVFLHRAARGHFFTRNSRHQSVHQLCIDPTLLSLATARDLPEAFPGRCLAPLRDMNEERVHSLLEAAAQFRLKNKGDRLRTMARATSKGQAIYQAIGEALGYRNNKVSMAVLAQRAPLAALLRLEPARREAMLFGAAGFMRAENYDHTTDPATLRYLRELWNHWWKMRAEVEPESASRGIRWALSGARPMNHPQRRIGALAALLKEWRSLAHLWNHPDEQMETDWCRYCAELTHHYWSHHYTLTSRPAAAPMRLIGPDRARDILGNVLLPWAVGSEPSLWSAYCRTSAVGSNQKLRRARLRLFGDDPDDRFSGFSSRYFQQQALLQIFDDFCLADASECRDCPFPEQLEQWR